MLKTSLGIYGLNIRPVGNYRQGQRYTSHTSRSWAKTDLHHRGKRLSKLKNKITVHIFHYSYKILCDIAQLHENKCLYRTYKTTVIYVDLLISWNNITVNMYLEMITCITHNSVIKQPRTSKLNKTWFVMSQSWALKISVFFEPFIHSVLTEIRVLIFFLQKTTTKNWQLT